MEIGGALWNHAPMVKGRKDMPQGSMKLVLASVWDMQHSDPPGSAFTPWSMAAIGWGPARVMHSLGQMQAD